MIKLDAVKIAKFAISGIVGMGTHRIVSGFIKNNVAPETLIDKVTVLGASWVVSGIATTATKKYADETVDQVVEATKEIYTKLQENTKLGRINRGESTFEQENLDSNNFVQQNVKDGASTKTKWARKPIVDEISEKLARISDGVSSFKEEGLNPKDFYKCADGWFHPVEKDGLGLPDGWWPNADHTVYQLRRNGTIVGKIVKDSNGRWNNADV